MRRLAAAFLIGAACALWLFPVIAGPQVQQLRIERDEARSTVESLEAELAKLRETAEKRQGRPVVKGVTVLLEGPDQRVRVEAETRLEKELAPMVGLPVDEAAPMLLYSRLQGRMIRIDGLLYYLDLKWMSLGARLEVYGILKPVKDESGA